MTAKLVYITVASKQEAASIAKTLVEERLIACANVIDGVSSYYWWEGKVEEDSEWVIIAKTVDERTDSIITRVKTLHSANCPCIVFLPIENGNPDFLKWVSTEATG